MNPAELVLSTAVAVLVLVEAAPVSLRNRVRYVAVVVVVAAAIAVSAFGPRWQLMPVLVGAALAVPFAAVRLRRNVAVTPRPGHRPPHSPLRRSVRLASLLRRAARPVAGATILGLVGSGLVAAWAFPVPRFPSLSGPYPVGTTVRQWTDVARPEPATADPGDHRVVVAQLWYPAQPPSRSDVDGAPYAGRTRREARTVAQGLADYLGVPSFLLDGATRAHSHAVPDAPLRRSSDRYPVIVFSPGAGGVRTQNTAWAEDLASRGFVVAAVDHPYDSAVVVLADGRSIRTRVHATGDQAADEKAMQELIVIRAADLSFTLTQLQRLDSGDLPSDFTGQLDTARSAVAGHSLGGGAALLAARLDQRFAAVVDLDGFPYDPAPQRFRQPVLVLTADLTRFGADDSDRYSARLDQTLELAAPGYRLAIPGATHLTFTDAPLYLPPVPSIVGSLPQRTAGPRLTAAATASFLQAALADPPVAADLARYGQLRTYHPPG
jgi:dienelactone hydrolase